MTQTKLINDSRPASARGEDGNQESLVGTKGLWDEEGNDLMSMVFSHSDMGDSSGQWMTTESLGALGRFVATWWVHRHNGTSADLDRLLVLLPAANFSDLACQPSRSSQTLPQHHARAIDKRVSNAIPTPSRCRHASASASIAIALFSDTDF